MISTSENFETQPARAAPPEPSRSPIDWMKKNLFASWRDTALTLLGLYIAYNVIVGFFDWAFVSAIFTGSDGSVCRGTGLGACWPFIVNKFELFMYGRYPEGERWRVDLTYILALAGLIPLMLPRAPYKTAFAIYILFIFPIIGYFLLTGGFGLNIVETPLWGGLLVTLVIASVGITASFPIGILLALGRRSQLPVVKWTCTTFIEIVRGVPLITMLFMASVMLPLFLPEGVTFDKLLRALIGVAIFSGAYMAEVIRGGLQAIPRGQFEAADAMGLSYPQKMGLIILPQALKLVIPGIVNSFIALFKDTSLVLIIGLFDLLGIVQQSIQSDANWFAPSTPATGLFFAGIIFWAFCFAMSRYSAFIEEQLSTGQKS